MVWVRSILAASAALLLVAVGFSESRLLDVDVVLVAPRTMVAGHPQAIRTLALTGLEAPHGAAIARVPTVVRALRDDREIARAALRVGPDGSATGRVVLPPATRGTITLVADAPALGSDATTRVTVHVSERASVPSPIARPSQPAQARATSAGDARIVVAAEGGALVPPLASHLFLCAASDLGPVVLEPAGALRVTPTALTLAAGAVARVEAQLEGVDATVAVRTGSGARATIRLPVALAALRPEPVPVAGAVRVRSFRAPRAISVDAWSARGWVDAWSVRATGTTTQVPIGRLEGIAARLSVRASPTLLGADAADVLVGDRMRIPPVLRPVSPDVARCLGGARNAEAEATRDASALEGLLPLPPSTHGAPARAALLEASKRTVRLGAVLALVLLGLAVAGLAARAAWSAESEAQAILAAAGDGPSAKPASPSARKMVEIGAYVATAAFGFVALALLLAVFR